MRSVICLFSLFVLLEPGEPLFGVEFARVPGTEIPWLDSKAAKSVHAPTIVVPPVDLSARVASVSGVAAVPLPGQALDRAASRNIIPFPLTTRMGSTPSHSMTDFLKPVPSPAASFGQLATQPLVAGQNRFEIPTFGLTQDMIGPPDPTTQFLYGIDSAPAVPVPVTAGPAIWDDALPAGSSSLIRADW